MSISGPTVHQQLLDAFANVQAYLESERDAILDAKGQREELQGNRGDALDGLARHYLPELTQQAIAETWVEVRNEVMQVLSRKQEHVGRAELELAELNARRQALDQELIEINEAYDTAQAEQDRVASQVERELREDKQFVELSDRAGIAESALERAEANLHEIDQESSRKLPAYDQSVLFRYLYDRHFGTDRYTHRGLTRRLDRRLARYIDYQRARQGYEFLSQTPDQMRKIIAEDRQSLDTVMNELENRRDQAAAQHRLPGLIQQANQLAEKRRQHLSAVDALLEATSQKSVERTDVTDVRGRYYREAIDLFRRWLHDRDVSELRRRAEQTEDVTDDQIVARLMGVDVAIDKLEETAQRQRARLDEIQSFLDGLGRVIQRFRAAQFDSARSNFLDSLNIDEEVAQAHEQGDVDVLWKRIRAAQRWGAADEGVATPVAVNPMHQVLVNAMTQSAGDDHAEPARRASDRRAQR